MKTGINEMRNLGMAGTCAALLWLLVIPAICAADSATSVVVTLSANATSAEIQQALDGLPEGGGEVVLPPGNFEVCQPIVLERDHQTLRGSGVETILRLEDNANCPVVIMGEPVNHPTRTVRQLCVSNLFIDGNRAHQQRELWRLRGEGSEIRNNGITVQDVGDSIVEHVTCAHCRSGGLVTTRGVQRLVVKNLEAYDNEFDGLACYQTEDCLFTELNLHDNPGAGISLDLAFNHNIVNNAVLTGNDLGIFMRASRDNQFHNVSIRDSRHFGVFMAHAERQTIHGRQAVPQTECTDNAFTNLIAVRCGGPAFRVNNSTCTNNIITGAQFENGVQNGHILANADFMTVR
jgi:parallel beta helix pectate lyase-like protein